MSIKQPYISREADRVAYEALSNMRRRNRYEFQLNQLNSTKNLFGKYFEQNHRGHDPQHLVKAIQTGFSVLGHGGHIAAAIAAAEKKLLELSTQHSADEVPIG